MPTLPARDNMKKPAQGPKKSLAMDMLATAEGREMLWNAAKGKPGMTLHDAIKSLANKAKEH